MIAINFIAIKCFNIFTGSVLLHDFTAMYQLIMIDMIDISDELLMEYAYFIETGILVLQVTLAQHIVSSTIYIQC